MALFKTAVTAKGYDQAVVNWPRCSTRWVASTRETLLRLKYVLDPRGILNSGNLGWE